MTPPAAMFTACGVITITTDFGHQGPFVATMKGRMLAHLPAARIIDVTHEVPVYWPAEAGFWLARAFEYFPPGTVHVAVVDPGVGTSRDIVAVNHEAIEVPPSCQFDGACSIAAHFELDRHRTERNPEDLQERRVAGQK